MPDEPAMPPVETTGFEERPVRNDTAPALNGHVAPARPDGTAADPLQAILANDAFPQALRILAERVLQVEEANRRSDGFSTGEALAQFRSELQSQSQVVQQMGQIVAQMSQQRAVQELVMERNARASALDLAIKALPEADRGTPDAVVAYADAFLGYIKAGAQA